MIQNTEQVCTATSAEVPLTGGTKRYRNIDGLRAIAALCIMAMHVWTRGGYGVPWELPRFVQRMTLRYLNGAFADFVLLFYMIAAFSLSCGYYARIKQGEITLDAYYRRRYTRILPPLALLVGVDLIVSVISARALTGRTLAEAFTNLTLLFGFYPQGGMEIAGVGWTLGVIFGFYILFPFMVFLFWNRRRGWISLAVLCVVNVTALYFFERAGGGYTETNVMRWLCYFGVGMLLYLYREALARLLARRLWLTIPMMLLGFLVMLLPIEGGGYWWNQARSTMDFIGFAMVMIAALGADIPLLAGRVAHYLGTRGLEIYLFHIVVLRVWRMTGVMHLFGSGIPSFLLSYLLTLGGTLLVVEGYRHTKKRVCTLFDDFIKKHASRKRQ